MDVVFPLVMHYEFRSREAGGSANGAGFQHHTCKWSGGACPTFAQGEVGRQQVRTQRLLSAANRRHRRSPMVHSS